MREVIEDEGIVQKLILCLLKCGTSDNDLQNI